MPRWEMALLPWDLLCSPGRIAWEGDKVSRGQTLRLLDQSGQMADSVKIEQKYFYATITPCSAPLASSTVHQTLSFDVSRSVALTSFVRGPEI